MISTVYIHIVFLSTRRKICNVEMIAILLHWCSLVLITYALGKSYFLSSQPTKYVDFNSFEIIFVRAYIPQDG